jgi:hypothetical protein
MSVNNIVLGSVGPEVKRHIMTGEYTNEQGKEQPSIDELNTKDPLLNQDMMQSLTLENNNEFDT